MVLSNIGLAYRALVLLVSNVSQRRNSLTERELFQWKFFEIRVKLFYWSVDRALSRLFLF